MTKGNNLKGNPYFPGLVGIINLKVIAAEKFSIRRGNLSVNPAITKINNVK